MYKTDKEKRVLISSLNVKGLKGYFSFNSSIVFFCETWTKPNVLNLIKHIASDSKEEFIHKSDIDNCYSRSRPFGGQSWLFDKHFKLR